MENCENCGKRLKDKSGKCDACGHVTKINSKTGMKMSNNKKEFSNAKITFITLIGCAVVILIGLVYKQNASSYISNYNPSYSSNYGSYNSSSKLFNNLTIKTTNKTSFGSSSYKVVGTVRNYNSVAVDGYFKACFYSSSGTLLETKLVSLDTVEAYGTGSWYVYIDKDINYSTIKFQDSIITEAD